MARNRPSKHSDAQFALFVEQMKKRLDVEDDSAFDHAVRRLVGTAGKDPSSPSLAATLGNLPELPDCDAPDDDAIESAVRDTAAGGGAGLMVLIGHLAVAVLSNENLLIYILMVLLQTDEPSAAVVFSILTMRSRLELVSRLAWIRISDRATRRALGQVVRLFDRANRIRNEFLHAMQAMDGKAAIAPARTMPAIEPAIEPAVENGGGIGFVRHDPIDRKRLDGMARACRDLSALNRKIWSICRGFGTR